MKKKSLNKARAKNPGKTSRQSTKVRSGKSHSRQFVVALTSFADLYSAERFSHEVVQEKLAACCQIIPSMTSVYFWEGKIEKSQELLVIVKTTAANFEILKTHIKKYHPYLTPELISLPISDASKPYLDWLKLNCKS